MRMLRLSTKLRQDGSLMMTKISCTGRRMPGALQPTNYTVGIDIGQKQWNTKELARLDLRRQGFACGQGGGLQIPYRPLTGGNTFGIPYAYWWVYTKPSRMEDREQAIEEWPGNVSLDQTAGYSLIDGMTSRPLDVSLVNRNPWKRSIGGENVDSGCAVLRAGTPRAPTGSVSVFHRSVAPQSLQDYVEEKKRSRAAVPTEPMSEGKCPKDDMPARFRVTFKVCASPVSLLPSYCFLPCIQQPALRPLLRPIQNPGLRDKHL